VARRLVLWTVVLAVGAYIAYRYLHSGTHPAATLTAASVPVARTYARDVVSSARCTHASEVAASALSDACKTFSELHGARLTGTARIVRGCDGVASRLEGGGNLQGDDCVQLPLRKGARRGWLYVWLQRHGGGWQVAAAASELRTGS
jgi:hypothetical protein